MYGPFFFVTINWEREIPGRQKIVHGSNVPVLTSHAGLNSHPSFVHYTQPCSFVCQLQKPHCAQLDGFAWHLLRKLATTPAKPGSYQLPRDSHGRAELDAAGFIRTEKNDKRTHIKKFVENFTFLWKSGILYMQYKTGSAASPPLYMSCIYSVSTWISFICLSQGKLKRQSPSSNIIVL